MISHGCLYLFLEVLGFILLGLTRNDLAVERNHVMEMVHVYITFT
jgi:hypothetical protein